MNLLFLLIDLRIRQMAATHESRISASDGVLRLMRVVTLLRDI